MEMNRAQAGLDEFTNSDSVFFGISTDALARNTEFAKELGLQFLLLSDEDGSVARSYGVLPEGRTTAQRTTFVVGKNGKISYIGSGKDAMDPMAAANACKGLK